MLGDASIYRRFIREKNDKLVLTALAALERPTRVVDIMDWIVNKSYKWLGWEYQKEIFDIDYGKQESDPLSKVLDTENVPAWMKRQSIPSDIYEKDIETTGIKCPSRQTIHEALNRLMRDKLVEKHQGKYQLTDKVKQDIRFLANVFSIYGLYKLFTFQTKKNPLGVFATRLGIYMIYTWIEATKPFKDKSVVDKDKRALGWIENSIDLERMFMYFLANFMPIVKKVYDPKEPRFELPEDKYNELSKALKAVNPAFYKELTDIQIFSK